ncbi:MAG: hypothetical protein ACAH95_01995 [Fimbriimonas sp.]
MEVPNRKSARLCVVQEAMTRVLMLLPIVILAGCSAAQQAAPPKPPEVVKLEAGTPVKAILMKELTSGGTQEGEDVPLMVSEDIKDAKGRVLVPKGSPITGKVTWSRTEGTLGSLLNQPARLKVKIDSVKAVDGVTVKLSAEKGKLEECEFNRENTGKVVASGQLEKLAGDKANDAALQAIRDLFEKGDVTNLDTPEGKQKLAAIVKEMGLTTTSKVMEENQVNKVTDLVLQIRRGSGLVNLATGGTATLVDAAVELAGVAGQIGDRLGKMVGGRNIRAFVGTPVEVFVLEPVDVKVPGS